MVANLDYDEIVAVSQQPARFVALSDESVSFLFACAAWYKERYNWLVSGENPTDAEWNTINRLIGKAEFELMNGLVGMIFPHVLASLTGMPFLPCDGSSYLRQDYPMLYAAIDPVYIIDADTFRVPDMRDRMPIGEGTDFALDDTGGEKNHLLTVAEMPLHSHTNDPHFHTESGATASVGAAITGVPVPSAIPTPSVTSTDSISIHNTGGDEPHNNMPPYVATRWAIVAG